MIVSIFLYTVVAACSCAQINFYIPFKSLFRCIVFGALIALTAWFFDIFFAAGAFYYNTLPIMAGFAVLASFLGIWACKTELCCGIYNVVIQLCINCIIWGTARCCSLYASEDPAIRTALHAIICMSLSGVWVAVMYALRRSVWIRMPMPDQYYQGVMFIVCVDYLMILGVTVIPLKAQMIAFALCMLVLLAALHAIRIPQFIIQERERTQMVLYQQQAMQAYIDSYTQYENRIRTMRHDLKHMVGTVTELIENNDYEKAGQLTREVSKWMDRAGRPEYSSDPLVNAIISDYAARFSSAGIRFDVSVRLTSDITLTDLELTTLLHNILSNAWEYCSDPSRTGPVWARLRLVTNRNYLFLECSNPLESEPEIVGEKILSSKKDIGELHGIGLESINQIVALHEGNVSISMENGEFVIKLMMLNSLSEREVSSAQA